MHKVSLRRLRQAMATKEALSPGTQCVYNELQLHPYRARLHRMMSAEWTAALQAERRCVYRNQSSVGRHRLSLHRTSPWLPRRWHVPRMRQCLPGMKFHLSREKLCLQRMRLCLLRMMLYLKRTRQRLCRATQLLQKMRLPKKLQSGPAQAKPRPA